MTSEVPSRPAATRGGRGASRGGRGGFGGRGSTRSRDHPNGDAKHEDSLASFEDQGEIGELKKLYSSKTGVIREMFPDWSEVDILFALRETDGDEHLTVTRIAEGTISQWDEVSKPKKGSKPKTKESTANATVDAPARTPRSGGAGPDKSRGRAGARPERGGRAARGRSAQPTNGTRPEKNPLSVPTTESKAWDTVEETPVVSEPISTPTPAVHDAPPSVPAQKTWASMLRQSTAPPPPKVLPKPKEAPITKSTEQSTDPELPVTEAAHHPVPATVEEVPEEDSATPVAKEDTPADPPVSDSAAADAALAPSKDQLTESNLEHVTDISHPPDTDTNQSEAADSWDQRTAALSGTGTPVSAAAQQHQQQQLAAAKAAGSGYAATAIKATTAPRTPSYSRRVLDQEEAVRMPGNREVDRAALQFGALSFNGAEEEDIDGTREEAETRAQPPNDSPVAHPRAALPPTSAAVPDAFAGQKPAAAAAPAVASSLPPTGAPTAAPQQPEAASNQAHQPTGVSAISQSYGRYGAPVAQETFGQKPFDAYGQAQPAANAQYDGFQGLPSASQPQAQQTTPAAAAAAAYSAAPNDYAQYLASESQSRAPYNNYYYQQQRFGQGHQDGAQNQQSYGAYPLGDALNQYPQSNTSRFAGAGVAATAAAADPQNSGTTTPNPPAPGQQQPQAQQLAGAPGSQAQHAQQHQGSQYGSYNQQQHPYYQSPYYSGYMYNSFGQGNFSGPYGKNTYAGGHHPYGMTPQSQYDPSVTQASGFGAASALHRGAENSALGGAAALGDYGRMGGANQAVGQQTGFGTGHDSAFARGGAGAYQGQGYGAQQVPGQQAGADDLKPYGDAKGAAGPTPSLARPGSAANTPSAQTGLPQAQAGQPGYGGYNVSHLQGLHGNQSVAGSSYGMGAGASQNHGNNPYGQYGHGGHSGGYGGGQGQGFGNNYSNQRGWGNNYH